MASDDTTTLGQHPGNWIERVWFLLNFLVNFKGEERENPGG
jgi:hypothetical protein